LRTPIRMKSTMRVSRARSILAGSARPKAEPFFSATIGERQGVRDARQRYS
jgi:hypothetical protein